MGKQQRLNLPCGTATFDVRCLIVAVALALAGCAAPQRAPDPTAALQVSASTWRQVDDDIGAASLAATGPAGNYARGFMESWLSRVRQRTEQDFIPWYAGYWTQQWLAIKVAWYKLGNGEERDSATKRLAAYLQEQYNDRVLIPVAREIDPDAVRRRATALYVRLLGEQLQGIPRRHGVPQDQFDQRLKAIPAIALAPPNPYRASLHEIVHADPVASLPAYGALIARISETAGTVVSASSDVKISPMAEQVAEKLVARLAISGGTTAAAAAAAAVGGVAGVVISLGAAGFGAIAHENERPALEAQLRENLNAALDERWRSLMEDPETGVMAGVDHISGQIEGSLAKTHTQPVEFEAAPRETELSGEPPVHDDGHEDEALVGDGEAEE